MRCPHCGARETRVVDSRDLEDSATIRRRRECTACTTGSPPTSGSRRPGWSS
jgi:transcriptional regulator NrdR family protein